MLLYGSIVINLSSSGFISNLMEYWLFRSHNSPGWNVPSARFSHTLWNEQNVTVELSTGFMNFKYFSAVKWGTWRVVKGGQGAGSRWGYYGILSVWEIMNAWLIQVHSWPAVHVQAEWNIFLCPTLNNWSFCNCKQKVFRTLLSQHACVRLKFHVILFIQQNLHCFSVTMHSCCFNFFTNLILRLVDLSEPFLLATLNLHLFKLFFFLCEFFIPAWNYFHLLWVEISAQLFVASEEVTGSCFVGNSVCAF